MLESPELEFLMEAHNGLTAKIVEESGFKGIWASGLTISASQGLRDNNEASWTQVLETLEFMSDAAGIPILVDGDTGYGNFNNFRRLIKKLEQRQIAGVCIEDKLFPKTNSFINGEAQPLADIEEFCGKIKAGKDTQTDQQFCVVARVEALITGWGMAEALRRAEAYRLAGADAILIHSKKTVPSEIEEFMKEWGNRHPVIVVPTTYYSTPTARFEELGISMVIWANHALRAAVRVMQKTCCRIFQEQSVLRVEDEIAPVAEIFRLQNNEEMRNAEDHYLPHKAAPVSAIILAASCGAELGELTRDRPKAMVNVAGKPILLRLVDHLNNLGIKQISIVRGFRKDAVAAANCNMIDNDEYSTTADLYSLYQARRELNGKTVVVYGDTLLKSHLLVDALSSTGDFTIVVDADVSCQERKERDMVLCSRGYTNDFFNFDVTLKDIVSTRCPGEFHGEWTGLLVVSSKGAAELAPIIEQLSVRDGFGKYTMVDLLKEVCKVHPVTVVYTKGGWVDVDNCRDLESTGRFYA